MSVHCAAVKERPGGARGRRMPKNTLPRHANCDVCVSVRTRRLMSFLCLKIPPGDGGWAPTSQFLNWAYQVLFDFTAPKDSQSSLVRDNSTTLTYLFFFFDPPPGFPLFFWCLFGSYPSQPFRLSPCILSCSLFTSLTYTDIPAPSDRVPTPPC